MGYRVALAKAAEKQLRKLDRPVQERIGALLDRIGTLSDPRSIGEALHGDLTERWKYRAGDWRLIAAIHDRLIMVEVIEIAHRSSAY